MKNLYDTQKLQRLLLKPGKDQTTKSTSKQIMGISIQKFTEHTFQQSHVPYEHLQETA